MASHRTCWFSGNARNLYSRGARFESQSGHRLPWLMFSVSFFRPSREMIVKYLDYVTIAAFQILSSFTQLSSVVTFMILTASLNNQLKCTRLQDNKTKNKTVCDTHIPTFLCDSTPKSEIITNLISVSRLMLVTLLCAATPYTHSKSWQLLRNNGECHGDICCSSARDDTRQALLICSMGIPCALIKGIFL
jgi:hypothetical protein